MSQETPKQYEPTTQIQQQISMLNLRINDMMTQLNATIKAMLEENQALKKDNTELKGKS
jgi:regulator of replication initiation timing